MIDWIAKNILGTVSAKEFNEYKKETAKQHETEYAELKEALKGVTIAQEELAKDQISRSEYNAEANARMEGNIKDLSKTTNEITVEAGKLKSVVSMIKELKA